jgi:membrane protein DedA with SNARE-associated domain
MDLDTVTRAIAEWGWWAYLLLALLVLVEGPAFTLLAGVAASTGQLSVPLVFLAAASGNLAGDALWYSLGRFGKIEWIAHYGRWLGVRPEQVKRLERVIRQHAVRLLISAKLTLGLIIPTLISAGLTRVEWRRWFPYLVVAECVWTGTLVTLGFFFGGALRQLEQGVQIIGVVGAMLVLLLLIRVIAQARDVADVTPSNQE